MVDLIHRYAYHTDNREFDELSALFTEDGIPNVPDPPRTFQPESKHVGRVQVAAQCAPRTTLTATMHAIVGHTAFAADTPCTIPPTRWYRGQILCAAISQVLHIM